VKDIIRWKPEGALRSQGGERNDKGTEDREGLGNGYKRLAKGKGESDYPRPKNKGVQGLKKI